MKKRISRKATALLLAVLLALAAMPVLFGPAFATARGGGDSVTCKKEVGLININVLTCLINVNNNSFSKLVVISVDRSLNNLEIINLEKVILRDVVNVCSNRGSNNEINNCINLKLEDVIEAHLKKIGVALLGFNIFK